MINHYMISILITLVVFEQNSIIIESLEIHYNYHNQQLSTSSSSSHREHQHQNHQHRQSLTASHHRLRHHHHQHQHQQQHHQHLQVDTNNPTSVQINNVKNQNNNDNDRFKRLPNLWKTLNHQNNPSSNIDNDNALINDQPSPIDHHNSMEFIGFDEDSINMKNLNSEYSVNTDSKEIIDYENHIDHNHKNDDDDNHDNLMMMQNNEVSHDNYDSDMSSNINSNSNNNNKNNNNNDENGDISTSSSMISSDSRINSQISDRKITSGIDSDNNNNNRKSSGIKCPKCTGQTNVRVSEEELITLRIEFVKNQILQKLRLKEKPKLSGNELPKFIYEGTQIGIQNDENKGSKDLDDYYARTSQKFIFLEQEKKECYRTNQVQHPSMCFSFKIDGDVDGIDVNTAELWVYKKQSQKDKMKQTFVVSEVHEGMQSKYLPKAKPIAIQSTGVEEGWIKFDIAWPIRKWFGNHDLNHIIEISCQSCELDTENLISFNKDYIPFIVIDTMNRRQRRRQKRSVNCTAGVTECCREKLYISFEEIGWDDWIIQPTGYNAYFCRGSCSSAASITMSNTHHSQFLRKVLYQRESSGKKPLELIPCCTAKQYSSLQLFYRDSNNTATLKTLPNMVVESCGCM